MTSTIISVQLTGPDEVELTWEAGVMQKVTLRFLSTGRTGDVYEALDAPYVLKIMRPELRAGSRNKKTASIPICSPKVFPSIYGVVSSGWHGRSVQISVAERVTHTMRSWFRAILARSQEPDEVSVQLIKHVLGNFFRQVLHMVNDLRLHLYDLTLDQVGVRATGVTGVGREEHKGKERFFHE